jgi:uncharacterized glyoxalase superfamily protein PhnB
MAHVKAKPEGYHTVTPSLVVRDAARAIEFYKKALGAKERMRFDAPDGRVMHAELQIGDSIVMLGDEMPEMGARSPQALQGSPVTFYLYFEDLDAAFRRAVDAGGIQKMPPTEMFWGDRMAQFEDPFGHVWNLAQHVKDPTPQEMERGQREFFAQMEPQKR